MDSDEEDSGSEQSDGEAAGSEKPGEQVHAGSGEDVEVPFAGTETYYAAHRPDYAPAAVEYLVDRFEVDEESVVLDLGCGAGQLAIPLAEHAGTVVGMDPNPRMLDEARRRAESRGTGNVELLEGSDADLRAGLGSEYTPFRLVSMGRSFHWMDQRPTLDYLRGVIGTGGGVAIVTGEEPLTRCDAAWTAAVYDVVDDFLPDIPERETGDVEYEDPWDEMLDERGYVDVETRYFDQVVEWSVDRIIGYVYSLSFAPRASFGDDAGVFEDTVRERLDDFTASEFRQETMTEVISCRNPERVVDGT